MASEEEILKGKNEIAKALVMTVSHQGMFQTGIEKESDDSYKPELVIQAGGLDANLYTLLLAQQIYAGDVILVQMSDKLNKRDYAVKLLQSVRKTNVEDIEKHRSNILKGYYEEKRKDEKKDE